MLKKYAFLFVMLCMASQLAWTQPPASTDPAVINWIRNTTGDLYLGDSTDVISVWYNNNFVYVVTNQVPSYYGGLTWASSSAFSAIADRTIFRLDLTPSPATTNDAVAGFVGIWLNGTIVASPGDGQYYDPNNQGLTEWARIAWYFEGLIFSGQTPSPWGDLDETYGHATPQGVYHYHVYNNQMIANVADSSQHSEIIGFAFDGYPIYGPYGYSDPNDASSGITRMKTSYQVRNITNRNFLPGGGTSTNPPPINTNYPVGCFIEDYEYSASSGDLDEHNGRFCITPDYPTGTYAYFITLDDTLGPAYPYMVGETYYGDKYWNGPQPSTTSIPANAVQFTGTATALTQIDRQGALEVFPNPTAGAATLRTNISGGKTIRIRDLQGRILDQWSTTNQEIPLAGNHLAAGVYLVELEALDIGATLSQRWIIR
ncbi:MAG: YHYH protein [Bacteroidota bacterium]